MYSLMDKFERRDDNHFNHTIASSLSGRIFKKPFVQCRNTSKSTYYNSDYQVADMTPAQRQAIELGGAESVHINP